MQAAARVRPGASAEPPIRVLIVDDSLVARTVIGRMLQAHGRFELAGQAGSAGQALALLGQTRVDVILLDLEMPGQHGLAALPALIDAGQGARVLIVSSACGEGAAATVKALALGAADTLLKPGAGDFAGRFAATLADRLLRIAGGEREEASFAGPTPLRPRWLPAPIDCVAIGASTGGVHALAALFAAWPRQCDAPVLVTQHLPAPFMPYFADQLSDMTGRRTRLAASGLPLARGEVLLAPGDGHISLIRLGQDIRIRIDRQPQASGNLPSVDPMMTAVGAHFGPTALGIMLSGMGRDGLAGAKALVQAGGEMLAQDAASSVVWGMPGVVAEAGIAAAILPPEGIAAHVAQRMEASPWR